MKSLYSLTYRQRAALVVSGGVLMLAVVALGYLRPTFALWRSNVAQTQALADLQRAPQELRQLTAQAAADAWLMRSYRSDTTRQEGYMLNQLSQTSRRYGVTLAALARGAPLTRAGYRVQTHVAKLRGPFRSLVQAVYSLEYEHPVGRLSSVRFAVEEDRKQRRTFLFAYLYLQSISQEINEKPLP